MLTYTCCSETENAILNAFSDCETYTTFGIDFSQVWAMQKSNDTIDVRFFVRAGQNIQIRFYQKPSMEYPSVTVSILIFKQSIHI